MWSRQIVGLNQLEDLPGKLEAEREEQGSLGYLQGNIYNDGP